MRIEELSRNDFLETIHDINYRDDDIKEAIEFGCNGVFDCYRRAKHSFAKYYIIYENDRPIVSVMLQRDGHIIFFIDKVVHHPLRLVKKLKRFARTTAQHRGTIITKTASWYNEALHLNRLTGFKPWKVYNKYGFYIVEE